MAIRKRVAKKPRKVVVRRVPAVSRCIALLRFLGASKEPQGLLELARALSLVPSTCLHIIRVLVDEGLVSVDPSTKRYQLGSGILALANSYASRNSLVQVLTPMIEQMSLQFGCAAAAIEPSGTDHYVVVATAAMNPGVSIRVSLGTRVPMFIGATGKCFAAHADLTKAEFGARFRALRWQNAPSFDRWYKEIQQVRKRGYAIDNGDYIRGISIISAPILNDQDAIVAAVCSLSVTDQLHAETQQALIRHNMMLAEDARLRLGYGARR